MGSFSSKGFDPLEDLPDLHGKVIIVTGGNAGVGFATVQHLARKGAKVYMACRNESKATAALSRLERESLGPGNGEVKFLLLDLVDPRSVKKSAEMFLSQEERLDVLVNNAALINDHGIPEFNDDGISKTMTTNHLGPFVFTNTLLPILKATAAKENSDVRIVTVGSNAHTYIKKADFSSTNAWNDTHGKSLGASFTRYCYSKMASHLWFNQLLRRLDAEDSKITMVLVHPGAVLSDGTVAALKILPLSSVFIFLCGLMMNDSVHGAYPSVFAAASPQIREQREKYHGAYLKPGMVIGKQTSMALDETKQKELWDYTEKLLSELKV